MGEQNISTECYRLIDEGNFWRLDFKLNNNWLSLHRTSKTAHTQEEILKAHSELFLTEKSINIRDAFLKIAITDSEVKHKRKTLVWFSSGQDSFFKSFRPNGTVKQKNLDTLEEARALGIKKFGMDFTTKF